MSEESPLPEATAPRGQRRRPGEHRGWRSWAARLVLVALVAGALFAWRDIHPVACYLAFNVSPTLRADAGPSIDRAAIRHIEVRVQGRDGALVAHISLDMPRGVHGPTTPPVVARIPCGRYTTRVVVTAASGREAHRVVSLHVQEAGLLRVDLDGPRR